MQAKFEFQFLTVRLKRSVRSTLYCSVQISIPHGPIEACCQLARRAASGLFQFLTVRLKQWRGLTPALAQQYFNSSRSD